MHRICSIFRNCSVITPEVQHIHSIPPFHCPLHCPTHCLERCFAYTDVCRYFTLYKPCTLATEQSTSSVHIPCPFPSEASDRLHIFQSSVIIIILDIVHLETCLSALTSIQVQYLLQQLPHVHLFQLPHTQTFNHSKCLEYY